VHDFWQKWPAVGLFFLGGKAVKSVQLQKRYAGAAELRVLKRRQKTVEQIGKITGTLKVVAQSRLAIAQEKAANAVPFYVSMDRLFKPIVAEIPPNDDHTIVSVIIYTDRGLCGACNNGINRKLDKESLDNTSVVIWGEKGAAGFEKSRHKKKVEVSGHPNLKTALSFKEISGYISSVTPKECDYFRVIFNKMKGPNNSEIQEIMVPSLKTLESDKAKEVLLAYTLEATSAPEMLDNLSECYLNSAINYAIFNNLAVELFQRRNSMQNASSNAKEVVQRIKIKYNKARQGMITTELCEIVSGAAAVDEMIKART